MRIRSVIDVFKSPPPAVLVALLKWMLAAAWTLALLGCGEGVISGGGPPRAASPPGPGDGGGPGGDRRPTDDAPEGPAGPDAGGPADALAAAEATMARDAGGADLPPEADAATPATDPACGGAVLCEGFESTAVGSLPGAPFSLATPSCAGSGSMAVDDGEAHGGRRSLRVQGGGTYCDHVFLSMVVPTDLSSALFLRFHVRLGEALGQGHVTLLALHDGTDGKDLRLGGQNGVLIWNRESNDATLPALSPTGVSLSTAPAPQQWHCVEVAIDGPAGTLETWLDGRPVEGLQLDTTPTPDVDQPWLSGPAWRPRLLDLRLGWESYAGQPMTLWFDDLAVGPSRLGCP